MSQEKIQRFLLLDAARGFAAFGVMFFHYSAQTKAARGFWDLVDLFFLLSGFVLAPQLIGSKRKSRKSFILARFIRIYPLLFVVILFEILVQRIPSLKVLFNIQPVSLEGYLGAFALLQIIFLPAYYVNIVLWSLSAEIFVNFLACFIRPAGRKLLLLAGFGMSLTALGIATRPHAFFNHYILPGNFFFPTSAFGRVITGFYLGLHLRVYGIKDVKEARPLFKVTKIIILSFALTFVLPYSSYILLLIQISFYFLVQQLASFDTSNFSTFQTRVCLYLGKISYGVYLWHFPLKGLQIPLRIKLYCIKHFDYTLSGFSFSVLSFILQISLVILATEFSLKLFEKPIQKFIKNIHLIPQKSLQN